MTIQTTNIADRVKCPFVDRREFIKVFQDSIEALGTKKYSVQVYYGVGGIGKTSLRKELPKIIIEHNESQKSTQILWESMDFEVETHQMPYKFLEVLATRLHDKYGVKFYSFEIARAVHLKKIDPRAPLNKEDFLSDGIIVDFINTGIKGALDPTSLIPKLLNFAMTFPDRYHNWLLQRREDIAELPNMEAPEIEELLPVYWAKDLYDYLNDTSEKAVLFLDSYEALWSKERHKGSFNERDKWIRTLVENLPECVFFVICGKDLLRWKEEDPEWTNYLDQREIGDLPEEYTIDLLSQCGVVEENIQKVIVEGSEGVPHYLEVSIDTYRKIKQKRDPVTVDFALIRSEIHARFIKYLDREKPTINALAVPNFWDRDILEAIILGIGTQYPLNELSELHVFSFISMDDQGKWRMHQLMRKSLIDFQDQSDIKKVHDLLFNYYDEKLKGTENRKITEEYQIALSEAFYHGKISLETEDLVDWFTRKSRPFRVASLRSFLFPLYYEILQLTEKELGSKHPIFSYILNDLGNLLSNMGRIEEAKQRYEGALKIDEALLSTDPENVIYQSNVGTALNNLGITLSNMGRIEEAKQRFDVALKIYEALLSTDPENVVYQLNVGMTLTNLGNLLSKMGRIEKTKQRYEGALKIYETLLSTDPENVVYQLNVGLTLNNLGDLLSNMGRIEEAKQRLDVALKSHETLLSTDPENVVYQLNVGSTLNNLGNLLSKMGRIEEAKQRYEVALNIRETLLSTELENIVYQSDVGTALNNLGNLLSDMGRIEEAKQRYEVALNIRETLLSTDPENVVYQSEVGSTLNNLGNLLSGMGRIEEAKQRFEVALKIYEALLITDPENVVYQSDVGATLNNLGALLFGMGRIEEAKQRFEVALKIYEALLITDPENVVYQSNVGATLNNLGFMLSKMGRIEEAKQRYEGALKIRETLLITDPENVVYQLNVGMTLNNLGNLLSKMG